jgi:CRISPR/Cas system-associated endonuclease Cas3-HD
MSREAFEKWAESNKYVIDINEDGLYDFTVTRLVWEAWQACEAEQSKRIAELEKQSVEKDSQLGRRNLHKEHEYLATMKKLQAQNADLVEYIKHLGMVSDTCTFNILKEVCGYCRCKRKKDLAKKGE